MRIDGAVYPLVASAIGGGHLASGALRFPSCRPGKKERKMSVTIDLIEPIKDASGETVEVITLREPSYVDYFAIGAPIVWLDFGGSGGYELETPALIGAWIERLCDCDPALFDQLNFIDVLALRDAVAALFPLKNKKAAAAPSKIEAPRIFSATAH
jgi:hypothetical protein